MSIGARLNVAGIAGCLVFAGALTLSCDSKEPVAQPLGVRLAFSEPLNYLPVLAIQEKMFERAGLKVAFSSFPTGGTAFRSLKEGKADVCVVGLGPFVKSSFEREDMVVLASLATFYDLYRVVARTDRGISAASDLRGKRIATTRASSMHFFLHHFLLDQGLRESDVELVFMKATEIVGALEKGTVDAFCLRDPFVSEGRDLLGDKVVVLSAPELPSNTLNLVTTSAYAEGNPEVVRRLLTALIEADRFASKRVEEAIGRVAEGLEIKPDELSARWSETRLGVGLEQGLLLQLEQVAEWMARGGFVEVAAKPPNYLRLVRPAHLKAVAPERVTVIR